jgi:drug/metabolite transporter (DMT)-like permease
MRPATAAAAARPVERSRPVAAFLWMLGAVVAFAAMTVAGRELSVAMNTFEIMAWRSAVGLPLVAAALLWREGWRGALTAQPGQHAVRNVVHFVGQNLWFYGIAVIPLAQLVALEFTNPIWVALLAPLILGERLTAWKLAAALIGFGGVLAIARPGVAPLDWGHAAGLGAALGFALSNMLSKRLLRLDSMLCVLFWMTLSQLAMGVIAALALGGAMTPPPGVLGWWAFGIGLAGLAAHACLTMSLRMAPASVVAPMEFLRLPVIAAVGLILYGEPIERALIAGAALILAANILNIVAERRATRGQVPSGAASPVLGGAGHPTSPPP